MSQNILIHGVNTHFLYIPDAETINIEVEDKTKTHNDYIIIFDKTKLIGSLDLLKCTWNVSSKFSLDIPTLNTISCNFGKDEQMNLTVAPFGSTFRYPLNYKNFILCMKTMYELLNNKLSYECPLIEVTIGENNSGFL